MDLLVTSWGIIFLLLLLTIFTFALLFLRVPFFGPIILTTAMFIFSAIFFPLSIVTCLSFSWKSTLWLMKLCGAVKINQVLKRRKRGREMWAKGRDDGYLQVQEMWEVDWWRMLALFIAVMIIAWLGIVAILFRDKEGNELGLLGLKWKPTPEVNFLDFA